MTRDEALAVGAIACGVDGENRECAADLLATLTERFPEHAGVWLTALERYWHNHPDAPGWRP